MRHIVQSIQRLFGRVGLVIIHGVLRLFGKKMPKAEVPWLDGPVGDELIIGEHYYRRLAKENQWDVRHNAPGSGLTSDFDVFDGPDFDVSKVDPAVRDFYEHTSEYRLDVWSETHTLGRLMLWSIVSTVSRLMNQLNFPVLGLELSRGLSSDIVQLCEGDDVKLTGWFRKIVATNHVMYTGFYMPAMAPKRDSACIKVVFPVPRGNATVFLKPSIHDGRFRLDSGGEPFGAEGFYRLLELDKDHWKVLHMRTLKERFEVYTDEHGQLRCDHLVSFFGITILKLHYKMNHERDHRLAADRSRRQTNQPSFA